MKQPSMTHPRLLHISLLILAVSPVAAPAQDTIRPSVVQAEKIGARMRVDVSEIGRVEGRFLFTTSTTLTLETGQDVRTQIGFPDIERLWIRGPSTRRGAVIGALAGIAFGIWLGTEAASSCDIDGEPCFTSAAAATVGGLLSGAVGALVGAGIGFAIPTWRLRFP